ncbi:MAG: TRAM domain-containing protein, partial [Aquiluna sp.]
MSIELRIEKVAHGGVFVARPEGKVVLVSGAVDGELVRAEVTEEAKSFVRAEVVEALEPSPHRQEHIWPAAEKG